MTVIEQPAPAAGFLAAITPEMYEVVAEGGPRSVEPVLSVVVPTRERRDLVQDTVEALFQQDAEVPFEVIVVDNASNDGTAGLLRELAARAPVAFTGARMHRDEGPAVSRNAGVRLARGELVGFTDSDCVPSKGWVSALVRGFGTGADVVQGRTEAPPRQKPPLFSHFIETKNADGSFSTSNVAYRRETVLRAGGFDATRDYWEDVDLGWRAVSAGARFAFADDALVYHQVIKVSPLNWLMHPRKLETYPAKAALYPGFRSHLFLGVWVDGYHALMTAGALGLALSVFRPRYALLSLPYLVAFPLRRKLNGRWPALKALAHFAHDCVAFASLVRGSVRHRRIVL